MSTITETLKAKLDELDLDRRLDELTRATEDMVKKAVAQMGDLAHDNREKVSDLLDKAGTVIDAKTDGKYHDQVAKVRSQVEQGVDKLAAKRPAAGDESWVEPAQDAASDMPGTGAMVDEDLSRATDEGMAGTSDEVAGATGEPQEARTGEPQDAPATGPQDAPTTWGAHTDRV